MVRFGEYMLRNVGIVFLAGVIVVLSYLRQVLNGLPLNAPGFVALCAFAGVLAAIGLFVNTLAFAFPGLIISDSDPKK